MKVKGIQTKFNVLAVLIAVVYVAIMILFNVGYAKISVATIDGSYASEFADKKKLNKIDITDNQKIYFDVRYENFEYNKNSDDTICLESYKGNGESVVIPYIYNDNLVSSLGENFFEGHKNLKHVYLPLTVDDIKADVEKDITLYVDKASKLFEDSGWEVKEIYDSEFVNHFNSEIPFSYNETSDSIELVNYNGTDDVIVIPSYIDGKPVKTVSFDMLGDFDLVVFPETVTEITGEVGRVLYTPIFAVGLVFSVIAFVLALIFVNIVLPKMNQDLEEIVLSSPQVILSVLYLVGQLAFSVLTTFKLNLTFQVVLVTSVVWTIGYIVLVMMAKVGRQYEKNVESNIEVRTTDMKKMKEMVKGLADEVADKDLKKEVERMAEEIKYLSLGSKNPEIENQLFNSINEVRDYISKNDVENIKNSCRQIILLCKKR